MPRPSARRALAALAVLAVVPACGGDDQAERPVEPTPTPGQTGTIAAPDDAKGLRGEEGKTTAEPEAVPPGSNAVRPEQEEGGAGDEEAIRVQALITGRGGRLRPRRVSVPPFIAVNVRLRAADGGRYAVSVNGRRLVARPGREASLLLDGLPPGRRYVLRPGRGTANGVTIVPNAEPGP